MYCPKCGKEEEGKFCSICGTELQQESEVKQEIPDEELEIIYEKKRKKLIIYAIAGAVTAVIIVIFLIIIGMVIVNKDSNEVEDVEEFSVAAREEEETVPMTAEEKRNRYYFQILEEYQKVESGEALNNPRYVNELYINECSFSDQNPQIYVALLDLCGDGSPELIITKYDSSEEVYKIIDMYGYEEGEGGQIFVKENIGYGENYYICENGMIKEEIMNMDALQNITYYSMGENVLEAEEQEKAYERDGRYYYESTYGSIRQEITGAEYEEFRSQYTLLTNVNWNQLSLWEYPDEYR